MGSGAFTGKEPDDAVLTVRQSITEMRGNLNGYIAVEERRPDWRRDPLRIAEKLLEVRRLDDALDWARRGRRVGARGARQAAAPRSPP